MASKDVKPEPDLLFHGGGTAEDLANEADCQFNVSMSPDSMVLSGISYPSQVSGLESFSEFEGSADFPGLPLGPGLIVVEESSAPNEHQDNRNSISSHGLSTDASGQIQNAKSLLSLAGSDMSLGGSIMDLNSPSPSSVLVVDNFLHQNQPTVAKSCSLIDQTLDERLPDHNQGSNEKAPYSFPPSLLCVSDQQFSPLEETIEGKENSHPLESASPMTDGDNACPEQRPGLDGSSSDSDDGAFLPLVASNGDAFDRLGASDEDSDSDAGSLPEVRQLAEGGDVLPYMPGDGGGGGDGSSGHSDSDMDGDGGVSIRVNQPAAQAAVPRPVGDSDLRLTGTLAGAEEADISATSRERECPVGDSFPASDVATNVNLPLSSRETFVSADQGRPYNYQTDNSDDEERDRNSLGSCSRESTHDSRISGRFFLPANNTANAGQPNVTSDPPSWMNDDSTYHLPHLSAEDEEERTLIASNTQDSLSNEFLFGNLRKETLGESVNEDDNTLSQASELEFDANDHSNLEGTGAQAGGEGKKMPFLGAMKRQVMLHSTPDVPNGPRPLAATCSGAEINPFDSMGDNSLFKFETKDSFPLDFGKAGYEYGDFSGERVNDSEFQTICSDPNALFDEDERNHQDSEALSNIVYASMTDWTINSTENMNRSVLSNVMGVSDPEDKGELRISWYFGCKSGDLGQLNPQSDCPRPQFDDSREIRSPEQLPPIAILKGCSIPFSDPTLKSTGSDGTFIVPPQEERPVAYDSFFEFNTSLREESLKLKRELVGEDSFEESVTRKELNKPVAQPAMIEQYARQSSLSESIFSDSTVDSSYGRFDRSKLQRKMEETLLQEGLDATQVDASRSVVSRIIKGIESGRISLAEMSGIQISDLAVNLASESKSDTALIIKLLFSLQSSEKRRKRAEMKSRVDQSQLERNVDTSNSTSKRSLKQSTRHSAPPYRKETQQGLDKTKEISELQITSSGTISKNKSIPGSDFNNSGSVVSSKSTTLSRVLSVSGGDQNGSLIGVLSGNSKRMEEDFGEERRHTRQRSSSSLRTDVEGESIDSVPDKEAAVASERTRERRQPLLRDCGVQCNFSSCDEDTSAAPLKEKSFERVIKENSRSRVKSDAVTQSDERYASNGLSGSQSVSQENWSVASLVNSYPKEEDTIVASSMEPRLRLNVSTGAGTAQSCMNSTTVAATHPTTFVSNQFTDSKQVKGRDEVASVSRDLLIGVNNSVTTTKVGFQDSANEEIKEISLVSNKPRRSLNPENRTGSSSSHMHYIDGSQSESRDDMVSLSQVSSLFDSEGRPSLDFVPTHDRIQPPATSLEASEKAVAMDRPLENHISPSVSVIKDYVDSDPVVAQKSSKSTGVIYVDGRPNKPAESNQFEGPNDSLSEFGYQTLPIQGNSRQGKEIENLMKKSIAQAKVTNLLPSVIVDSELLFREIQCVGVTSHQLLALHNAGSRWVHCRLKCDQYAVNRSKVEPSETCAFNFQDRLILPPHTTEKIKVKFAPKHPGLYVGKIAVESSPAVPSAENPDQRCEGTQVVHVEGFAELPHVEILQEDSQIDFGEISYGTSKTRPIRLVTKSQAAVPIRMIISGSATVWPCFQFVNCDSSPRGSPTSRLQRSGAMTSPPMLSFTLPGKSEEGTHSDPSVVWVQFRAPHKEESKGTKGKLGPPEEFTARVDVEVHGKGTDLIIGSVLLKALVGQAKLYGAKDLKAVTLSTTENQRISRSVELLNAGNISMHVDLKFQSDDGLFAVLPDKVVLRPGQKTEVFLHFESPRPTVVDTYLLLFLPPHGPCHELQVRGMAAPKKKESDYRQTLLCDKPVLCWAGVQLGQSKQQTFTLRNNSHHHELQLCLSIQGGHSDFQIQNAFGNQTKDEGLLKIAIKPQEDIVLYVLFIPSCFGRISSALIVRSAEGGSKYLIPLHGHGGTSQVVPSLVRKSEEGYWYSTEKMVSGKSNIVRIVLRNVGVKDAFIKAVCYTDLQHMTRYPESLISLPDDFVLPEKASKDLVVMIQPTSEVVRRLAGETSPTLYLVIYSGDEWLRQLYKRKLPESGGAYPKISSGRLKNLSFTSPFSGEDGSFEDVEYPDLPDWESFFQSCVHQTVIAIVENGSRGNKHENVDNRIQTPNLLVQDLMPVTPAAKLLSASETRSTGRCTKAQKSWLVTPERITLTASQSFPEKRAAKVHVVNHTKEALRFNFFWPGEVLEVTPNEEEIPPKSQLAVVINIKHSFMLEKRKLPWQGSLYVRVGVEQKIITAQIREDIAVEISPYAGLKRATEKLNPLISSRTPSPESEQNDAVKVFSVMPTLLHFKGTSIKSEEEDRILMQNNGDCAVKWLLASVAPTYLKANINSGDIFRVTYSAFRFERLSGKLRPGEGTQVKVAFRPWDEGLYSQYWDVRISSEDGHIISKIRLQLDGECPSEEKDRLRGVASRKQVGRAQPIVKEPPHTAIQDPPSSEAFSKKSSSNQLSVAKTDKYQGLFVKEDHIVFEPTDRGCEEKAEFRLCNNTEKIQRARLSGVRAPFYLKHFKVAIKPKSFVRVPVFFAPTDATNSLESLLVISTEIGENLCVKLSGKLNSSGGWR